MEETPTGSQSYAGTTVRELPKPASTKHKPRKNANLFSCNRLQWLTPGSNARVPRFPPDAVFAVMHAAGRISASKSTRWQP